MNKISVNLLTNVVLLLAGVLLIVFHQMPDVFSWVARIFGALFLLPSVAYLLMVAFRHAGSRTGTDYMGTLPAVGGLCFGVLMLARPVMFEGILSILMGVLLLALGLFHVVYLLLSWRTLEVKAWYLVLPLVVLVYGLLILTVDRVRQNVPMAVLLAGVSLLLFNFTSLQEYMAERRARRRGTLDVALPADESNSEAADDQE
ncbi:MAG: DUF308 domain-containing protein [Muribaculaceae bacterium]|nr:DUF308 domain-containing protein [Muribaculaceae bacterium]